MPPKGGKIPKAAKLPEPPVPQTPEPPLSLRREPRSTRNLCPNYTPNPKRGNQNTPGIGAADAIPGIESTPGPRSSRIPAVPLHEIPSPGRLEPRRTKKKKGHVEANDLAKALGSLGLSDEKKTAKGRKKKAQEIGLTSTEGVTFEAVDEGLPALANSAREMKKKGGKKLFEKPVKTLNLDDDDEEMPLEPVTKTRAKNKKTNTTISKKAEMETVPEYPRLVEIPESSNVDEEYFSGSTEDQDADKDENEDEDVDKVYAKQREVILNFINEHTNWSTEKSLWHIEQADVRSLHEAIELHRERGDPVKLMEGMLEVAQRFQDFRDVFDEYLGLAARCGLYFSGMEEPEVEL